MPRGKHGNHRRGSSHPRWKGGRALSSHGYIKVQVGVAHPLADPNGYAYEHHLVLADAGIELSAGDVTHHINGDKGDNRIQNLEVATCSAHNTHHNAHRARDRYGRLTTRELAPPLRDPVTGQYLTGPTPKAGGRLLDGREWDEMPDGTGGVVNA